MRRDKIRMKNRNWDKKDLERRLCHALDVAVPTVERLAARGYTDQDQPDNNVRAEKVVSETALLLLAASTVASIDAVKSRIDDVARRLIPYARSERIQLSICLEPSLALDFASAHICLTRLGYRDDSFDALLYEAVGSQALRGRERVPHRILEQEWLRETWRADTESRRRRSSALRASVLCCPMDLLAGSREDVYALTHALMYACDFNIQPHSLPRPRAGILSEADVALARALDGEDYDLAGEVLLAWPLTGRSWSASAAFGLRILTHVEDQAGFLPAPITRLQRINELSGDRRTDYLYATAYHTIYVMGLLCAAALQTGRTPPARIPSVPTMRGNAAKLLVLFDSDRHRPHWQAEFERLSTAEQDALSGFLMNIALLRSTRKRDFSRVERILSAGHAMGLTDTPCASQAAEMLQRLAAYAANSSLRRVS